MLETRQSGNGDYCVLYCRVSTKKQEERGLSLDAQQSLLRGWAKDNNFYPVETFRGHESASKSVRKGLRNMLKYCDDNAIKNVLVEKTDRLNRNDSEIEALIEKYRKKNGFKFYLIKDNEILDGNLGASQKFVRNIRNAAAGYMSDNLTEEVLKGIRERLEKGGYPGLPPFGYKTIAKTRAGKPPQIIQTDGAEIMKKFLETFSSGKFSVHQSVRLAKDLELKTKTNSVLSRPQLARLIKNRFYYGEFVWTHAGINGGEQKIYENKTMGFEPIISKKTWEKNQAILKNNQKNFRTKKLNFRFNDLMTCGKCGRKIYGTRFDRKIEWDTKKGQKDEKYKYEYYLCTKGPYLSEDGTEKRCATPSFRGEEIERMLMDEFNLIKFNTSHWKKVKALIFKDETKDLIVHEIKMLKSELTKKETALEKMYNDYCEEIIDADFFKTKSEKIRVRQKEIKDRLEELEEEKEHFDDKISKSIEVLDAMKNWSKILENASDEKKKHLIELLTFKISTVHDRVEKDGKVYEYKGLEFTYSPEVRELFEIGILEADKKWHASNPPGNWGLDDSLNVKKLGMSEAPLRI